MSDSASNPLDVAPSKQGGQASNRRTNRIVIPTLTRIKDQLYDVVDWSFNGFAVEQTETLADLTAQTQWDISFILPYEFFEVSFAARVELKHKESSRLGFEWLNLDEKKKKLMRQYVDAVLAERLDELK